jgi:nitrite reductase/ring-hydroxylating ferredoxin subunit/uncharacterized membrane protein
VRLAIARLVAAQDRWAKPLGEFNHRWLSALFRPIPRLRDLLSGTWIGHPIHAAITDVPIGALGVSVVLDLAGQPAAADIALVLGVLAMVGAAVSGAADYSDTDGGARVRATTHSTIMVVALVVFLVSLALRAAGPADRTVPIAASIVGFLILAAGAYVGGDVVYLLGNMVSRHAFGGGGSKWLPLEAPADLPDGVPTKARLGQNTLVLVRTGDSIAALHETCAHAGGPLSGGRVVDGCLECPWHGSRFRLADGRLVRGPSVYDQPAYEVRHTDAGGWEARRRG